MMAKISGQNLEKTIKDLRDVGLGSIPGGGAEILVERVRKCMSPLKGGPEKWLEVMEVAHSMGIKTTGTMMFGLIETIAERVEHLRVIRDQQDRAIARNNGGGHTAFAAWPFQSKNTVWDGKLSNVTDVEYLRTVAISRIYLDNFPHIQSSWVTMGHKTGQMALHYGCDDMGSLMFEEEVVRAAGANYFITLEKMKFLINKADFTPWQRNAIYCSVN
jgi:cyclic dehypoxanthinyl futalosine synthase